MTSVEPIRYSPTMPMSAGEKTLSSRLTTELRAQILEGQLLPGARLPTELELARTWQVSRGTVRQVLSALESEGLLDRAQRRGTFVRHPNKPRALAAPAERRIGLVLSRVDSELDMDILLGVEGEAKSRGYQISFAFADERIEEQWRDVARLQADRVAGLVIFPVSDVAD